MTKVSRLLVASSLLGSIAVAAPASAAVIFTTNEAAFQAAAMTNRTLDFNNFTSDQSFNRSPVVTGIFTFSVDGPGVPTDRNKIDALPLSDTAETSVNGTPVLNLRSDASNSVVFTFSQALRAIGFDLNAYGNGQAPSVLTAFNGNTVLGSLSSSAGTSFLGIYGNDPITSLRFSSAENDLFGLDNIDYAVASPIAAAVPEPATWAMMIVGFGMAGAGLRRRKVTTRVSYAA